MRKNSVKNRKINDEVRRVLAQIISGGIKDPRVSPMASITDARVTADLKYCTVYVSVLGDEQAVADTLAGLKSASGYIRRELAHTVNLRITPELRFVADNSMSYGAHIESILGELKEAGGMGSDEENEEENGGEDQDGGPDSEE